MRVLVTGASGFIGSRLAAALVDHGHTVHAIVRAGSETRLPAGAVPIIGDFVPTGGVAEADRASWARELVRGVDIVYHLAAARDRWGLPYRAYHQVNVEGTRVLLEASACEGVARFVYCSSAGVAEYDGCLDADESLPYHWDNSKYNYHHTKMLAEKLTLNYAEEARLATTVVRPCITYGSGDTWGMVPQMVALLARGRYVMAGNGHNHVHLVHVDDLVKGLMLAAKGDRAVGRVYIVAGSEPIRMNSLIARICSLLQVSPVRWHLPVAMLLGAGALLEAVYSVRNSVSTRWSGAVPLLTRSKVYTVALDRGFSTARARSELGYQPTVSYEEGLQRAVEWYSHYAHLSSFRKGAER